jgi:5,10-methylenetetrahydromethanopterin reductase
MADRFSIAGTPEEIVHRIRTDVLPSGIDHVVLALTDRGLAKEWAGGSTYPTYQRSTMGSV